MSVNVGSLLVSLGLDSAEFKTGLSNAEKEFKRSTKRIESIGNSMGDIGKKMSLAVTAPLVALGVTSVKAAVESNKAFASVEATLASMGSQAGLTANQLAEVASDTMKKSLYDDDEILQKVTNTLLTFGKVSGDTFLRAQQAAIDLSAKFGKDLQGSTLMVGKAIQEPVKGLTALTRAGISFSPAQASVIKSLVATGQAAKAQELILKELEKQVAGSAAAMRKADPMAGLRLSFGEFQEEIGKKLLPLLPRLTEALTTILDAFGKLSPGVQTAIIASAGLAAAFGPLLGVLGLATKAVGPFIAGIRLAGATAAAAGVQVGTFTLAMQSVRAAIVTAAGAVAPFAVALAALGAVVYYVYQRVEKSKEANGAYAKALGDSSKASEVATEMALKLANAHGRERLEVLAAARAHRENAKQKLESARKSLVLAKADLMAARAQQAKVTTAALDPVAAGMSGGIGGMMGTNMVGESQSRTRQAQSNLGAATKTLNHWAKTLDNYTAMLSAAEPPQVADIAPGKPGKIEKPNKQDRSSASGPSAAEIEQRFQDERATLAQQYNSAMASAAKSAEEQAEYEMRNVELARIRTVASIKNDADYSAVQKERLIAQVEDLAEIERQAVERQKQQRLFDEALSLADEQFRGEQDALRIQLDLADTQAERKRLALALLDAEYRYHKAQLEAVVAQETLASAKGREAQAALDALNANYAGERASVGRRNETEVEAYLRNLRQTPEQINQAIDGIRIDGLEALNDGIVQAITGVKSLGAVFKNIANQIISDLLRIAIRKAIIEPLANSLFGGSGGGGGGFFGSLFGRKAAGGHINRGMPYLTGERGPEIIVPGSSGSVIPNRALKGLGGGGIMEIRPSPLFEVYVDGKLVQAMPIAAEAGARGGVARMAYQQRRRVA